MLAGVFSSCARWWESVTLSSLSVLWPLLPFVTATLIAVLFIVLERRKRKKTKIRTVLRVLFTRKIWFTQSTLLDAKYTLANACVFPVVIAYVTMSAAGVGEFAYRHLTDRFGAPGGASISGTGCAVITTVALYLAYEFAYWFDHYLSHKIPFLWEFHKVHHSAEVLTPLTNKRVHPVDSMVFINIVAVCLGVTYAVIYYLLGKEPSPVSLGGENILIFTYMSITGHLQHSQLWIPFTGVTGRFFLSPAHHQIHHSNNPVHYDKNLGASLAVFDWLFGTLHIPARQRERLTFGVNDGAHLKALLTSTLYPFAHSLKPLVRGRVPDSALPMGELAPPEAAEFSG